ncbi:MAG: Rpn family recombination-promoting nuclease/putative transposase [Bacteroidales bacterium]|nr:Rpn family recombination-promoting nuclease/putative transposase [Bacteroidales bacterium]
MLETQNVTLHGTPPPIWEQADRGGLEVMTGSPWPCEWVSRPGGSDGMSAHEVIGETGDSRKGFIDVLCTDTDGNTFIVEMQNAR